MAAVAVFLYGEGCLVVVASTAGLPLFHHLHGDRFVLSGVDEELRMALAAFQASAVHMGLMAEGAVTALIFHDKIATAHCCHYNSSAHQDSYCYTGRSHDHLPEEEFFGTHRRPYPGKRI